MNKTRKVTFVSASRPTREGAGVLLKRAFGKVDESLDPFLLLDEFGSDNPSHYLAGFPWHPHRGIETITYMLEGKASHGDSLGNKGVIGPGDVQWMTAGSGIIHEEMPQRSDRLRGFQLWSNLPASHKMMEPRYQDVAAKDIPLVKLGDGAEAKVICGQLEGTSGPVQDIITEPQYLDLSILKGSKLCLPVSGEHNVFAYVVDGEGSFDEADATAVRAHHLVVFGDGEEITIEAGADTGLRFLLVSGRPIREPVAWGGPIVMNTQQELHQAFAEYRAGTFIKHEQPDAAV